MKRTKLLTPKETSEVILAIPVYFWQVKYDCNSKPGNFSKNVCYKATFDKTSITVKGHFKPDLQAMPVPTNILMSASFDIWSYIVNNPLGESSQRSVELAKKVFKEIEMKYHNYHTYYLKSQELYDALKKSELRQEVLSKLETLSI